MLTLRFTIRWIVFVAIMAATGLIIRTAMNGATVQDEFDRLNWEFYALVVFIPIGLFALVTRPFRSLRGLD